MAKQDLVDVLGNHFDRIIEAAVAMERLRCIEIVRDTQTEQNKHDLDQIVERIKKVSRTD